MPACQKESQCPARGQLLAVGAAVFQAKPAGQEQTPCQGLLRVEEKAVVIARDVAAIGKQLQVYRACRRYCHTLPLSASTAERLPELGAASSAQAPSHLLRAPDTWVASGSNRPGEEDGMADGEPVERCQGKDCTGEMRVVAHPDPSKMLPVVWTWSDGGQTLEAVHGGLPRSCPRCNPPRSGGR